MADAIATLERLSHGEGDDKDIGEGLWRCVRVLYMCYGSCQCILDCMVT